MKSPKIGLALSGGGSRAIAFHLGCLRALHDRGILRKISVLSGVSGGSVIAALYAYSDEPFEVFASRVERMLSRGFVWGIVRETFLSRELPKILVATILAGVAALLARSLQLVAWLFRLAKLRPVWLDLVAEWILDLGKV